MTTEVLAEPMGMDKGTTEEIITEYGTTTNRTMGVTIGLIGASNPISNVQ